MEVYFNKEQLFNDLNEAGMLTWNADLLELKVKLVYPQAKLPTMSHEFEDAAWDLYTPIDFILPRMKDGVDGSAIVDIGIIIEFPILAGSRGLPKLIRFHGEVGSRSGLGFKKSITAFPGVIDNGYRNNMAVKLFNRSSEDVEFKSGDRVAQLLIRPFDVYLVRQVDELSSTKRGITGFGDSGR